MNIRIIAALRTAAYLATVIGSALLVFFISEYFSMRAIITGASLALLTFVVYMVYHLNLKELQREQHQNKTVDQ